MGGFAGFRKEKNSPPQAGLIFNVLLQRACLAPPLRRGAFLALGFGMIDFELLSSIDL